MAEVVHVYKQVEMTNVLDLSDRAILKGIAEFNHSPVVFTWKYKMDEVELI